MTAFFLTAILLIGTLLTSTATAQIIGPGPKQGKLQFGGWRGFMHYDQLYRYMASTNEWHVNRDVPRDRAAFVLRYGVTDRHYVIMNFGALQRKHTRDNGDQYTYMAGVLGIGGSVELKTLGETTLRFGGMYNDVFEFRSEQAAYPWRGREARLTMTLDQNWSWKQVGLTVAVGALGLYAREKQHDLGLIVREKNRHYLSPVAAGILTLCRRVNLGLELTFGAITDFRWRTEIQL